MEKPEGWSQYIPSPAKVRGNAKRLAKKAKEKVRRSFGELFRDKDSASGVRGFEDMIGLSPQQWVSISEPCTPLHHPMKVQDPKPGRHTISTTPKEAEDFFRTLDRQINEALWHDQQHLFQKLCDSRQALLDRYSTSQLPPEALEKALAEALNAGESRIMHDLDESCSSSDEADSYLSPLVSESQHEHVSKTPSLQVQLTKSMSDNSCDASKPDPTTPESPPNRKLVSWLSAPLLCRTSGGGASPHTFKLASPPSPRKLDVTATDAPSPEPLKKISPPRPSTLKLEDYLGSNDLLPNAPSSPSGGEKSPVSSLENLSSIASPLIEALTPPLTSPPMNPAKEPPHPSRIVSVPPLSSRMSDGGQLSPILEWRGSSQDDVTNRQDLTQSSPNSEKAAVRSAAVANRAVRRSLQSKSTLPHHRLVSAKPEAEGVVRSPGVLAKGNGHVKGFVRVPSASSSQGTSGEDYAVAVMKRYTQRRTWLLVGLVLFFACYVTLCLLDMGLLSWSSPLGPGSIVSSLSAELKAEVKAELYQVENEQDVCAHTSERSLDRDVYLMSPLSALEKALVCAAGKVSRHAAKRCNEIELESGANDVVSEVKARCP